MLLSDAEKSVLNIFHDYLMEPGEMLCFHASSKQHRQSLRRLIERRLVVKEQFAEGYSLTESGYIAMRDECQLKSQKKPRRSRSV